MSKYTIGVDFGTLSVRALVVDVKDGTEIASACYEYPHGIMTEHLPDRTTLGVDWALQHPMDYLCGLERVVTEAMKVSGLAPSQVIGLGIDFTSSTSFPVDKDGTPLCMQERFSGNPYAWPMLWKHHAAQHYANRMTELAHKRGETFLENCGGRISAEMMFPRLWQIAAEAPQVYDAAARFMEAGDWIVRMLTGSESISANPASFKLFWNEQEGYPSAEFWQAIDPRLCDVTSKLGDRLLPLGSSAGGLNEFGSQLTGLARGTPVSVTCIDAHTALPAAGVTGAGQMLLILGTSAAHLVLAKEKRAIGGILCRVKDGIMPGYYAYEAGQSCCGDHFKWFADRFVPREYEREADERGVDIQQLLTEKARELAPGESGLVALDWWNGNRSVLMDTDLSGLLIGLSLQTRPEEIYRALIEATAFGTRKIVENFKDAGIEIKEVFVCGGIARKNEMLMQIYADVLKRPLKMVRSRQANALGTAIYAAVAAGKQNGGYDAVEEAACRMGGTEEQVFLPYSQRAGIYDRLYREYLALHDFFGAGGVMHRLGAIKKKQNNEKPTEGS